MARQKKGSGSPGRVPDAAYLDRAVEPEYASVSGAAIAALALAVVGLVALLPINAGLPLFPGSWFQVPLLVFIPLGTIPFALAVGRSIRRSEGTKVGLPLARAALALALVATVGSAALHGAWQYREHRLEETLVEASNGWLERLLKGDYRSVFDELALNTPPPPGPRERQFEFWKKSLDDFLYKGGDYYGRTLSSSQRYPPEKPEDPPGGLGLVVYKFRFSEGCLNLQFLFRLDESPGFGPSILTHTGYDWRLVSIRPERGFEFPEAGEKPKKRFE